MKKNRKCRNILILSGFLLLVSSCERTGIMDESYIDPHIIFTSRRWWNYDIYISDIYGNNITHLTKNQWLDFNPEISPNGKKLAYISNRDGNREIYLVDLVWMDGYTQWEGNNLMNISNSSENEWTPKISPLNNKIVFTRYFPENDNYDVFIMNIDGSNKKNITNTSSYEKFPQFSPDGSFIIYQSWISGKMEISFTNLLENNKINLTRNTKSHDIISQGNAISPDGQKIIFTSERDGNKEIYIMTDKGKNIKNISNNDKDDWNPRYFPDNRKVVFQSLRDGPSNWEIYVMNIDGTNQLNISNYSGTDYSYVVLPLINQ